MGGLDSWVTLLGCFLLWLSVLLLSQPTSAQEGFVSLKCCAPSNTTDPITKITWISDSDLFHDGGLCRNISVPVANDTRYKQARIFGTGLGNKWCYNLTTIKNQSYLVRATFLYGSILRTPPETLFTVLISTTWIRQVNSSSSPDSLEVEGIFKVTEEYIDFCLVRVKGNPYISKLELRPLNDSKYLERDPSNVLNLVSRVDVGNTGEDIRYSYDPNDRIWAAGLSLNENSRSLSNAGVLVKNVTASIPLEVLQTALTGSDRLEFLYNELGTGDYDYLIFLYFLELNASVKAGQRVFDIYVNGQKRYENFDILANGTMNYREAFLNVTANEVLNISLIKVLNGVEFGPICSAYEILQVRKRDQETVREDVDAIVEVRDELLAGNSENELLGSWSGDPCLPLPWQGLGCELSDGSFVITKLDLSSNGLQGYLPSIITELIHLKELNLSFNHLTGNIPPFPVSSMLISMDLSHNEFMGTVPDSLASLPHLTKLYFRCNPHFSNELPSSFNRSDLITDSGVCGTQGSSSSSPRIFIGSVAAGGSLLLTVAVGVIFLCLYRRKLMDQGKMDRDHPVSMNAVFSIPSMDFEFKSISIDTYTLAFIEAITEKYKTMIGEGGFGSVFRGTLPDGQEVAVKVRSATSTQGTREFENELNFLSAIRHEHLVPLLGHCCEKDQQILVYPFMSNGSLQDRLYGEAAKRKTLDWQTRLSIALGAARGLLYLHTFAGRCVIHRDVKSSNILLDQSMCAKVADFGFSKYAPQEGDSAASLEVRGTAGYLDPEYYLTQHLSAKSDVFSFGVVLLEIISGREPLNIQRPRSEWSLVEWAKPFIRQSRIEEVVDPSIKGGYHAEAMWRVVEVALTCIESYSAYRPCMADIVRELEDALIIENNASEYMKSIDSFGGSNRFSSAEKKIVLPVTPTPTEPSPISSQALTPPQPR